MSVRNFGLVSSTTEHTGIKATTENTTYSNEMFSELLLDDGTGRTSATKLLFEASFRDTVLVKPKKINFEVFSSVTVISKLTK